MCACVCVCVHVYVCVCVCGSPYRFVLPICGHGFVRAYKQREKNTQQNLIINNNYCGGGWECTRVFARPQAVAPVAP